MDLAPCSRDDVDALCARFHSYGGSGSSSVYSFAVRESGVIVAAFQWQPPALGCAKGVCTESPQGVLALSRMVAVPREQRELRHISKPLRVQMKRLIDRTRWPVLVTYSDEGEGHTGHVYKCSGWQKTVRRKSPTYIDRNGKRAAPRVGINIADDVRGIVKLKDRWIQRWEHWVCEKGDAAAHMERAGWVREPIPGKVWRSGNPAFRFVRKDPPPPLPKRGAVE